MTFTGSAEEINEFFNRAFTDETRHSRRRSFRDSNIELFKRGLSVDSSTSQESSLNETKGEVFRRPSFRTGDQVVDSLSKQLSREPQAQMSDKETSNPEQYQNGEVKIVDEKTSAQGKYCCHTSSSY